MAREWIRFDYEGRSKSGVTSRWKVMVIDSPVCLGVVTWYANWRKYAFQPFPHTVFEEDCLRRIAEFCETQTKAHRQAKASGCGRPAPAGD